MAARTVQVTEMKLLEILPGIHNLKICNAEICELRRNCNRQWQSWGIHRKRSHRSICCIWRLWIMTRPLVTDVTCCECYDRRTGPAFLFSHPDPRWTWLSSPSWRASSGRPPSWARCSAVGRRRRQGRWGTEAPIGSMSCTQCSQTSHPKSGRLYLIDSWK